MSDKVTLYFSSISSSQTIKQQQRHISMIMESKEIPCAVVDVAASAEDKAKMREIANDPACLPPQIAFGESYCGDYAAFEQAVESEELLHFLKLQ